MTAGGDRAHGRDRIAGLGERRHGSGAPRRHVDRAVGADHHAIRVPPSRQTLRDAARAHVDDGEGIGEILRDVQAAAVRGERQLRWVADAGLMTAGRWRRKHDAVGKDGRVAGPTKQVDTIGVSTGCAEPVPVRRKREAEECCGKINGLRDLSGSPVDDLDSGGRPSIQ